MSGLPLFRTVYHAIWEDSDITAVCQSCNALQRIDLRRLAMFGHGRTNISAIAMMCDCGGIDFEFVDETAKVERAGCIASIAQPNACAAVVPRDTYGDGILPSPGSS